MQGEPGSLNPPDRGWLIDSLTHRPRWPRGIGAQAGYPIKLAILCAVYFGAAKAGLAFAFANQSVTSIWPPTGIALAAVLIWGYRMWPAIWVGAFLANITTAGPVLSDLAIATGNTLEAVVGAYLLSRVAGFRPSLDRVRDVVSLVVFAGLLSTAISAIVGVTSLWAAGLVPDGQILPTWRVWWFGDLGGDLVVAPALLILAARPALPRRPWVRVEAVVLAVVLVAVTTIAFSNRISFAYVVIVILLWTGLRFQQLGTAVAGLVASGIAIWATAHGRGPFIGGSEDAELLRAQLFVGVAMTSGLVASALNSERATAVQRLQELADHDTLTGVLNRRRFTEELDRSIAYSRRYGGQGAVLVLDVDHFKSINDEFGHAVGDQVLARLGALLRERVRGTDVVGRLGGDEFTVLLPRADAEQSLAVARAVLDKLRSEGTVTMTGRSIGITASIGVGRFGQGLGLDSQQVLRDADVAMYEAKEAGRDRVRVNRSNTGADKVREPG
jgi:diguanylate cyclase (GGDEF)-like protein